MSSSSDGITGSAPSPDKTLFYTVVASTLSVAIGLVLVNVIGPGRGLAISAALASQQTAAVQGIESSAAAAKPLSQIVVELVPRNPLDSAVKALDGEMLPFMVFALLFGFGLSLVARGQDGDNPLVGVLEQVFAVCMKIVDLAMTLAPFAVFAIIFNTAFRFGYEVFRSLFFYVATVVLGLLIQQFVVYSVLRQADRAPIARCVLRGLPRCLPLRVLDRFVQRDAASVARDRRTEAASCRRTSPASC